MAPVQNDLGHLEHLPIPRRRGQRLCDSNRRVEPGQGEVRHERSIFERLERSQHQVQIPRKRGEAFGTIGHAHPQHAGAPHGGKRAESFQRRVESVVTNGGRLYYGGHFIDRCGRY